MSKPIKASINRARSLMGKKNGVVPWLYDDRFLELRTATSKKIYKRNNKVALTSVNLL